MAEPGAGGPVPTGSAQQRRSRLLAELDARLDRFGAGDHDALAGAEPFALIRALATETEVDVAMVYSMGLFHHYRLIAELPAVDGVDDAAAALAHFRVLYRAAPDLVPEPVRELVSADWSPSANEVERWRARATDLQRHPRRFELPELFSDAIYLLTLVVDSGQLAAEQLAPTLSQLTLAYIGGFEATGDLALLDDAVAAATACLEATRPDDPHLAGRCSNLAATLATRYDNTGASGDLERAVEQFWAAVDIAEGPERSGYLSNLGGALLLRHRRTGDSVSLNQAVQCGRQALSEMDPGDPARPRMLAGLALASRTRFTRSGQLSDIDEAVRLLREAVAACPAGHPDRAGVLSGLSTALRVRFGTTGQRADLDAAVEAATAATEAATGSSGTRSRCLSNLGAARSARFRVTGDRADLDAAVAAQRAAADLADIADPVRATVLANLGLSLRQRAELDLPATRAMPEPAGDTARDLRMAATAYADSAAVASAAPLIRAVSSYDAGLLTARSADWPAARAHLERAVALLDAAIDHDLGQDDQQYGLGQLMGLGPEAAAVALRAGTRAEDALGLLERSRGVLLSQALARQGDLAVLGREHPDLADRWEHLRRALAEAGDGSGDLVDARLRRSQELRRALLLAEIRELPGHADFFRPMAPAPPLAPTGLAVVVNVARAGCDALVVAAGRVTRLPLERLSYDEARVRANELLMAIGADDWTTNGRLRAVLRWAWDAVMQPIMAYLDRSGLLVGAHPQVWWIPTGPLTVLPLHAAEGPDGAVVDRVVSSYAATLRTLARAAAPAGPSGALVVAVPDTPGHRALAAAEPEARQVAARLVEFGLPPWPPLVGAAATRAEVLARLPEAAWAHFACHAAAADNPADSHLVLYDGVLTVRELLSLRAEGGYLAYLSACTTAFSGTDLVDEALHVSSVFQLIGYRNVIGTLWPVVDKTAQRVAGEVYAQLGTVPPALALHRAVLALRERYPDNPRSWAAYLHVGGDKR
ncbi:CHAT domain-containing protein [Micromonospora sp. NPDC049645]|uniref:CHAT domain-containing tetratricopeptide repeat protein n=1 Tax=Micromonospora sp. NPDC049645 TaxID=3155508 RepID=UPI00342E779E